MGSTEALQKIWQMLLSARNGAFPLNVEGALVVEEDSTTPHFEDLAATEQQIIPVGAKGYAIIILTGTATINGKTAPAGMAISDSNKQLATITVICGTPGTAFVAWNT